MKRIDSVIELFVLVIFCDLSVANPPMWGGGGSSSPPAVKESEPWIYGLNSLVREKPTGNRSWLNPRIYVENFHDATKYKYILLGAYDEHAYENTGKDTNLVFYYGRKMMIQAGDDKDAAYYLDFEERKEANLVAEYMVSTDSARYKKCTGSNTFQLEKLYMTSTTGPLIDVAEKPCIFKIRKSNLTMFVIRRTEPIEDQPLTLCVFRSNDYELLNWRVSNDKSQLRLFWRGDNILQPRYVLETLKRDKMRDFLSLP